MADEPNNDDKAKGELTGCQLVMLIAFALIGLWAVFIFAFNDCDWGETKDAYSGECYVPGEYDT